MKAPDGGPATNVVSVSGFVAPYLVGWVKDLTGNTNAAVLPIAACMTLASLLVFRVPARLVNR